MITFEWSEGKNRRNRRKHGIDFATATRVFNDPNALMAYDGVAAGEDRWRAIGRTSSHAVAVVAYSLRGAADSEVIRVISARWATKEESQRYEAQVFS